jgi:probable rRNA maturation factor
MAECGPSPDNATPSAGIELGIDVVRHDEAWDTARIDDALLERAARAALAEAPALPAGDYELTILLTGDEEMRALNRTWRGKDASTNVLSFPAQEAQSGPGLLGDIALAYETIRDEARDLSLADHVSHLVVHGVLHLIGFDHVNEAQAERMEAFERRTLASLGIADPYTDQPHVSELLS